MRAATRGECFMHKRHSQPTLRARATERCAFLAERCAARRVGERRFAEARPFRLCCSASLRLMTLLGRSSGSTALTGLPAALRRTSVFSALSYSSLNFDGSKCAALVSRMWLASLVISPWVFGFLILATYFVL